MKQCAKPPAGRAIRILVRAALCAAFLTSVACVPEAADTVHGKNYRNELVSFTYPGNWKVTDEQLLDYPFYTTVENEGNAVTIVFTLESADDVGLEEFIRRHIDFFSAEMDKSRSWEAGRSTVGVVTKASGYESVTERFSLKRLNADSPHTRYYRRKESVDYVCYVVSQAPDNDLPQVESGFRQIVETLAVSRKRLHGVE